LLGKVRDCNDALVIFEEWPKILPIGAGRARIKWIKVKGTSLSILYVFLEKGVGHFAKE